MFRDPFQTWNSWKKWWINKSETGFNLYSKSYQHAYKLLKNALQVSSEVSCITLEKIAINPAKMFKYICQRWEIPYDDRMLNWSIPFGENTTFTAKGKDLIENKPDLMKSLEGVREGNTFNYVPVNLKELKITSREIDIITRKLMPIYREISQLAETFYQ